MQKALLLALPLLTTVACAHMPRSGVESNGQEIRVAVENRQYSYTVNEKVGQATHKDKDGKVVGTTDITRTAVRTRRYKVWEYYQGRTLLDEADYFRLVGDTQTSDYILRRRARGKKFNRIGLYTVLGGVAGMLAGYVIFSGENSTGARSTFSSLGALTALVGGYMAYYGKNQVERRHMPLNRALDAYDMYAQERGQ